MNRCFRDYLLDKTIFVALSFLGLFVCFFCLLLFCFVLFAFVLFCFVFFFFAVVDFFCLCSFFSSPVERSFFAKESLKCSSTFLSALLTV